jgi:pyruvate,water dikinase
MYLAQHGYPVPDGFVLTSSFFAPWMRPFETTEAQRHIIKDARLTSEQQKILAEQLDRWPQPTLFAVRSSAPDEDQETGSFAGLYKSALGVARDQIGDVLPEIVASCFDFGVATYRLHFGLSARRSCLAVIIQEQVASDIAGIAFSRHPVTGDGDQVVIESNWGLGLTAVGGTASPDHFIVDKRDAVIVERRMGRKERTLVLQAGGGLREIQDARAQQWSLTEEQIRRLTDIIIRLEREHGCALDMEWAIKGTQVLILQVRPITCHGK